jgi:hypothetical protein
MASPPHIVDCEPRTISMRSTEPGSNRPEYWFGPPRSVELLTRMPSTRMSTCCPVTPRRKIDDWPRPVCCTSTLFSYCKAWRTVAACFSRIVAWSTIELFDGKSKMDFGMPREAPFWKSSYTWSLSDG